MLRSLTQCLPGLALFVFFVGCGGVADSGLFGVAGRSGVDPSQAGQPGAAGASSFAGAPAVGGAKAVAGASSVAGATALAGAPGGAGWASGGSQAGSGASGAANAGSSTGGAARGGSSGNSACAELYTLAAQQLLTAQTCNMAMSALPCSGRVNTTCGCVVPVQRAESAETLAYLATLQSIQEKHCVQACPAVLCPTVKGATCSAPTAGSIYGKCTATVGGAL